MSELQTRATRAIARPSGGMAKTAGVVTLSAAAIYWAIQALALALPFVGDKLLACILTVLGAVLLSRR